MSTRMNTALLTLIFPIMPLWAAEKPKVDHLGTSVALKGTILYVPGSAKKSGQIFAVSDGKGSSPLSPEKDVTPPAGKTIVKDPSSCVEAKTRTKVPLKSDEEAAALARGDANELKDVEVVLAKPKMPNMKESESEAETLPSVPTTVRIFQNQKEVVSFPVEEDGIFPCGVILDNFDGKSGNEIAVTWVSVAAGYSAGVSLYRISK